MKHLVPKLFVFLKSINLMPNISSYVMCLFISCFCVSSCGPNNSKTSQSKESRARQADKERIDQIRERTEREHARSYTTDPEILLLMQKNDLLDQAAEHFKVQKERRNKLRDELVEGQLYYQHRKKLVDTATEVLSASKAYYLNDDFEEGAITSSFIDVILDLATSFTTEVSSGRSIYEAITGQDLLSSEELDSYSRATSILNSVTFVLESDINKKFKVMSTLLKGGDKSEEALKTSKKLYDSGR